MDHRAEIIKNLNSTTSVPASALQAMRLLQDPNANMGEVVQTINYDPGITSNILKLANSSYFGCSRAISTLKEAIVRLGSGNVFKLVTAAIANSAIRTNIHGYHFNADQLWDHSVAVAVAADNLYDLLNPNAPKIAFTAGLLHDIGKVVLGKYLKDKTLRARFIEAQEPGKSILKVETEVLGINHAEVGGLMLQEWNIPANLVDSVRWQYEPERCPESITAALIHICNIICLKSNIGSSDVPVDAEINWNVFKKTGINADIKNEVVLRTRDSFENIKDIFSKRN
jgi:putative nucleotidyltransferase with HDIG domain